MANREVTVKVTQIDIDYGRQSNAEYCPVALAFGRLGYSIAVYGDYGRWLDGTVIKFPMKVLQFVADYDTGNPVHPFVFNLNVPDHVKPQKPRELR